jgi:hypothetical protein
MAKKTVVHYLLSSKQGPSLYPPKEPKKQTTVLEWICAGFRFQGVAAMTTRKPAKAGYSPQSVVDLR